MIYVYKIPLRLIGAEWKGLQVEVGTELQAYQGEMKSGSYYISSIPEGEKCMASGCVLEAESIAFADGFEEGLKEVERTQR